MFSNCLHQGAYISLPSSIISPPYNHGLNRLQIDVLENIFLGKIATMNSRIYKISFARDINLGQFLVSSIFENFAEINFAVH